MIQFEEAERIARDVVRADSQESGVELQIIPELTITKPYGWVFFYQSAKYIRTMEFYDILIGTAPFLVQKIDGRVITFGTAFPIERYLDQYEKDMGLTTE